MTNTISEALALIKAENLKPLDVFRLGDLLKDPMVAEAIEDEKKEAITFSEKHRARDEKGFDKTKAKLESDHKEALDAKDVIIKKLTVETSKTKANDLFKDKAKERKLTKEQIEFIDLKKEEGFNPQDPEQLGAEVNQFIDKELKELKSVSVILGKEVEEEEPSGGGEPNTKPVGGGDASIIPD